MTKFDETIVRRRHGGAADVRVEQRAERERVHAGSSTDTGRRPARLPAGS